MDFLLLSILCFDQEIPLPAIASAMDFMHSKMIGETLRRCGAFFIRRNVGKVSIFRFYRLKERNKKLTSPF